MLLHADDPSHYADADKTMLYTQYVAGGDGDITVTPGLGSRGGSVFKFFTTGLGNPWTGALSHVPAIPPSGHVCGFAMRVKWVSAFANIYVSTNPEGSFGGDIFRACLFTCRKGGANLWWVRPNINGTISVFRGSTPIATSNVALTQNVYTYLEVEVALDTVSGSVTIRFDEEVVAHVADINTTSTGDVTWDEYRLGQITSNGASLSMYLHDLSIWDGSGSEWNEMQGDTEWDVGWPNADSAVAWTPSAGVTNYPNVDETLANGDTDYNSTGTLNALDLLQTPAIATSLVIRAVIIRAQVKMASGSGGLKLAAKIGGTVYLSDEIAIPSDYLFKQWIQARNPAVGSIWAASVVNAMLKGYQKAS